MKDNSSIARYNSLNKYLRETFGCKVYKVSVDGGFSCPNRDGTIGVGGCIFCSDNGSGEFAGANIIGRNVALDYEENDYVCYGHNLRRVLKISKQLDNGIELISKKRPNEECKYIAYFQAFTNTYAPAEVLRKEFEEALNHHEIVAISIGTRPDCLSLEVLDLLEELNHIKPVWVELGLQTIHESTAKLIRRGYDLNVYDNACAALKKRGIDVVTHVILGLPGEDKEMMLRTVDYVAKSGSKGIKLQLLHVIKGTDLEEMYYSQNELENIENVKERLHIMTLEEYIDVLVDSVKLLPKDMIVHRLTGDGDKRTLVAPLWSADKKRVLNNINKFVQPM